MKRLIPLLIFVNIFAIPKPHALACSIFTVVRDGQVLMGNNEDYILPGVVWFVPGKNGKYGRVNVGFERSFAQGSMNEMGLSFDGAALQQVPWEEDSTKPTPKNLIENIMNECATVEEAIQYFKDQNCSHLGNSQLMFADASGDSAVITWMPEKGLSVVRIDSDKLVVTNNRLEESGYRGQRFVRAEQILSQHVEVTLDTMVEVMDSVHQRGPNGFTSYSTVYDLKNKKMYLYNLANYDEVVEFDVLAQLKKKPKLHKMRDLFQDSPRLRSMKKGVQRTTFDTRIKADPKILDRYVGIYSPIEAPAIQIQIERVRDELRVKNAEQPDVYLYPESEILFRVKPDRGQVTFDLGDKGDVLGMTLHKARDMYAKRINP